ncbi:hypothetical protein LTR08_005098 [Meristemomyces frigidus]|nr:hypothetical protein LTR08_005098 [Meristemomyces frigidus]
MASNGTTPHLPVQGTHDAGMSTTRDPGAPQIDTNPDETHSGFFSFPRELRNAICTLVTRTVWVPGNPQGRGPDREQGVYLKASGYCRSEARLVNRQFKTEYEEEIFGVGGSAHVTVSAVLDTETGRDACAFVWPLQVGSCLDRVRYATLWFYDLGRLSDAQVVIRQQVQAMVGIFPAVRTLTVELRSFTELCPDAYKLFYTPISYTPMSFLDTDLFPANSVKEMNDPGFIQINKVFKLANELYSVKMDVEPDTNFEYDLRHLLNYDADNRIVYSATPSTDVHALNGLHLTTVSVGKFDYDKFKAKQLLDIGEAEGHAANLYRLGHGITRGGTVWVMSHEDAWV